MAYVDRRQLNTETDSERCRHPMQCSIHVNPGALYLIPYTLFFSLRRVGVERMSIIYYILLNLVAEANNPTPVANLFIFYSLS